MPAGTDLCDGRLGPEPAGVVHRDGIVHETTALRERGRTHATPDAPMRGGRRGREAPAIPPHALRVPRHRGKMRGGRHAFRAVADQLPVGFSQHHRREVDPRPPICLVPVRYTEAVGHILK